MRLAVYGTLWLLIAPFLYILYGCNNKWAGRKIKLPANKFLSDMLSFLLFLSLIVVEIVTVDPNIRGNDWTSLDVMQFIWVLGLSARFLVVTRRVCYLQCARANFEHREWRFLSWMFLFCFWVYFILRFVALGLSWANPTIYSSTHRRTMQWYNPVLLAEICYGIGAILAVSRIFSYFKDNAKLGNLQVYMTYRSWYIILHP